MKKEKNSLKETAKKKSRKIKNSKVRKRTEQGDLSEALKEIRLKLKPLAKAYINFREKRKIKKQKDELKRLKEKDKQKLHELEEQRIKEQEEIKLKKSKKLKEEEEKRLKLQEERKLKEKKIKEDRQKKERQERIYKERLAKGEQERLNQLIRVGKLREEENQLIEKRELNIKSKIVEEQKLREEKKLKDKNRLNNYSENKRLNGKVKWYNNAKGYGFIKSEAEEKDIFVHFSTLQNAGIKDLREGEQLTFEVKYLDKGPSATNIQKIPNKDARTHLKLIK